MWKRTCSWTKTAKIIVTAAIGLLVIINVASSAAYMGKIIQDSATTSSSTTPLVLESKSSAATNVSDKPSSATAASAAPSESSASAGTAASQSSSSSSAAVEVNDAKFVGTWQLTSMTSGDETIGEEELQMAADLGMEITLTLGEDGSAQISMPEGDDVTNMSGTWAASSDTTVGLMFDGGLEVARLDNGTLILEEEDLQLVFKKR